MPKVCPITSKAPMSGHNVSHANNKTKRRFLPNLQTHRYWDEDKKCFITLRASAKGMRTIAKLGLDVVLEKVAKRKKST